MRAICKRGLVHLLHGVHYSSHLRGGGGGALQGDGQRGDEVRQGVMKGR
jgi:hypothetical protein